MNYLLRLTLLSCLCVLISMTSSSPLPSTNTVLKRCTSRMQLTVPESSGNLNSLLSAQSLASNLQRWKSWLNWSSSGSSVSIHNSLQATPASPTKQNAQDHREESAVESAVIVDTPVVKIKVEGSSSQNLATPQEVPKVTREDSSQSQSFDEDTAPSQNMDLEKQAYLKRSLSHVLELSEYLQQQDIR